MKKIIPLLVVLILLICPLSVSADRIEDTFMNSTDLSISGWNYGTTANDFRPSNIVSSDQFTFLRGSANAVNITATKPNDSYNWLIIYYNTEIPMDMNSLAIFVKLKRGNTVIESPLLYIYGTENERFGYYLMNNNNNMNGYSLYITTQKSGDFAICCPFGTGTATGFTIECYVRKYDNLGSQLNGISTQLESQNESLSAMENLLYNINRKNSVIEATGEIITTVCTGVSTGSNTPMSTENAEFWGNPWQITVQNKTNATLNIVIHWVFLSDNLGYISIGHQGGTGYSANVYTMNKNGTHTNSYSWSSGIKQVPDGQYWNRLDYFIKASANETVQIYITNYGTTDNIALTEVQQRAEEIRNTESSIEDIQGTEISYKIVDENGNETAETMSINNFNASLIFQYGQVTNWIETTGLANQIKAFSKEFEKILQLDWIKYPVRISMILMIIPFMVGMLSKGVRKQTESSYDNTGDKAREQFEREMR